MVALNWNSQLNGQRKDSHEQLLVMKGSLVGKQVLNKYIGRVNTRHKWIEGLNQVVELFQIETVRYLVVVGQQVVQFQLFYSL